MRVIPGLALLGVTLLTGCGQSETQIRDELRAQMMQRCNRDIAPNTSALPGFDSNAYCRCVTDRALGERNVAELKTLFDDRARLTAEGRQAATQCLAQLTGGNEGPAAAPAEEPAENVANAAAPAAAERARAPAPAPAAPRRPRIEEVRDSPQPQSTPVTPPRTAPATPPRPRPEPEPATGGEKEEPNDRS